MLCIQEDLLVVEALSQKAARSSHGNVTVPALDRENQVWHFIGFDLLPVCRAN